MLGVLLVGIDNMKGGAPDRCACKRNENAYSVVLIKFVKNYQRLAKIIIVAKYERLCATT